MTKPRLRQIRSPLKEAGLRLKPANNRTRSVRNTSGGRWRTLREAVMQRDQGLCQVCAKAGRVTLATETDHIVPVHRGGRDEVDALQAICRPCHLEKTKREMAELQGAGGGFDPSRDL